MTPPPVFGTGLMLLLPREVANMLEDARQRLGYRTSVDAIRECLLDLAIMSTDLDFIASRSALVGHPIDQQDPKASLAVLFAFISELQSAAQAVVAEFPPVGPAQQSVPRTHRVVQQLRDVLLRYPAAVPA